MCVELNIGVHEKESAFVFLGFGVAPLILHKM